MTTKRKKQVSDDKVTEIPVDLVINILSRLPMKSIAKCRCVSKLWSTIIRRPYHKQLFPINSPATPKLLFIDGIQQKLCFYSSPHPQIQDRIKPKPIYPRRHLTNSVTDDYRLCPPVAGLVCRQQTEENSTFAVISNPVTGEYVTTPKVTREGIETKVEIYFGYDPVDKVFKVLSMTWSLRDGSHKYQILTLGTGNLTWRKIQCSTFHYPQEDDDKGICINGVLYYTATTVNSKKRCIVCFDVRFEKFNFLNIPDENLKTKINDEPLILIDYKGELGVIHGVIQSGLFVLWVLKDAQEHKWSEKVYKMRHSFFTVVAHVFSAGMIGIDEIVFYHKDARNRVYVICYNLEKNVITCVRIVVPTLDFFDYRKIAIFSNFVEDVNLMS